MGLVYLIFNFSVGFNSTKLPELKSNQFIKNFRKILDENAQRSVKNLNFCIKFMDYYEIKSQQV